MPTRTTPPRGALRLLSLLAGDPGSLTAATRAEALALGPERAGAIVSAIVDEELASPDGDPVALNATILAFELELGDAIPALVRCVERLAPRAPLARAAGEALARMGPGATEALLTALERAPCLGTAAALARTRWHGDRVLDGLTRMLEVDPSFGPVLLGAYGDPRAIPRLADALDRATLRHEASPSDPLPNDDVISLAFAIEDLGGTLTPEQEAKRRGALDILAEEVAQGDSPYTRVGASTRDFGRARPGRNRPCPCGSGKKYKRCHLAEDEQAGHA